MPHPVQTSITTIGIRLTTCIAPLIGQRSTHAAQNEVNARQWRP
jgi:hypothetical protein